MINHASLPVETTVRFQGREGEAMLLTDSDNYKCLHLDLGQAQEGKAKKSPITDVRKGSSNLHPPLSRTTAMVAIPDHGRLARNFRLS